MPGWLAIVPWPLEPRISPFPRNDPFKTWVGSCHFFAYNSCMVHHCFWNKMSIPCFGLQESGPCIPFQPIWYCVSSCPFALGLVRTHVLWAFSFAVSHLQSLPQLLTRTAFSYPSILNSVLQGALPSPRILMGLASIFLFSMFAYGLFSPLWLFPSEVTLCACFFNVCVAHQPMCSKRAEASI